MWNSSLKYVPVIKSKKYNVFLADILLPVVVLRIAIIEPEEGQVVVGIKMKAEIAGYPLAFRIPNYYSRVLDCQDSLLLVY